MKQIGLRLSILTGLLLLISCGEGASGRADRDQVVRYAALGAKIKTLDPMDMSDTVSATIGGCIYDTLYTYHYLKRPYEIVPSLAADMPTVSEDGLTYTITLRDDVRFHDDPCFPGGRGRSVTMHDVVYSWKRLADIHNVSRNWWVFDGRIAGFNDFRDYTKTVGSGEVDYGRPVAGLQVVDDLTLTITLTRPWPQIMYMLAHMGTSIVPREAVEHYGDEFLNHPVGTGPYVLDQWRRGSRVVLVRNSGFRDEFYPEEGEPAHEDYEGDAARGLLDDAGRKLPFIDRLEFLVIEEDQPMWLKFMAGGIDQTGIPKDNYNQAITGQRTLTPELASRGVVLHIYDTATTFWYGFNMDDPLLGANLPLRRAMNLALDRERYLDLFMNDRGSAARGVLPPGFADYNRDLHSPYTTYDPQRAREMVREAEALHGGSLPAITLTVGGTDTSARQTGQFLERAYESVGIPFDVDYMDWPTAQQKVSTRSVQMYAMGWAADTPDAENFLQLFYGPNSAPGSNGMNYDNPKFNELYDRIAIMPPSPQRTRLVQQMEQMIVDDLPCVFTVHSVAFVLHYDWVRNYKPHLFGYGMLKYLDIDVDLRRRRLGR